MMFWRLLRRLLAAGRGRLTVALLALTSGASVCFALLNLQFDAERKFTREFRILGANLVVAPPQAGGGPGLAPALMAPSALETISGRRAEGVLGAAPFLYLVARAGEGDGLPGEGDGVRSDATNVIVAGTWLDQAPVLSPWWRIEGHGIEDRGDRDRCLAGRRAARLLGLEPGRRVRLDYAGRTRVLTVSGVIDSGGAEDSQIFVSLPLAQELAGTGDRIGLVQMSVRGAPREIRTFASRLRAALPGLEVRPVRQLTDAEGLLMGRIRLLILSTVVLILGLTALSVLATMSSMALERRPDVGLMKALGGSTPRVVRLFLAEVSLLGAAGGLLGSLGGSILGAWIGRSIFDAPIVWRLETLPLILALMVGVALLGALPLRLLGRVPPATILRGEG
jgi:putative ABC transport system permease protein